MGGNNMILDRNKYELMLTREMMKQKPEICVVDYELDDEIHIINEIHKFTGNLFIALEKPDNIKANHIRISCNKDTIGSFLNHLYSNSLQDNDNLPNENNTQRSIIFIKEQLGSPETFYDFFKRSYHFSHILKSLHEYSICDISFYNMRCVVVLSTQKKLQSNHLISMRPQAIPQKLILALFGGIGDHFMLFSIIYEYINRSTKKGLKVFLPIIDNDQKANFQFNCFFPEQDRLFFDNGRMYISCLAIKNFSEVISLYDIYWERIRENKCKDRLQHFTDVIKEILGIEKEFNPYQHRDVMLKKINDSLSTEEKKSIDSYLSNNDYVGFQFFTGVIDDENGTWATEECRNWNEENTQAFISLCKNNNISLLSFNNHPYNLHSLESIRGLSICGYAYAISKLKLVVGIDSSAGHIASFFGVPSITIWGKQTPVDFFGSKVSFQAMRFNHSIYTENGDINLIKPEYVFTKMKNILKKVREKSHALLEENSCSIIHKE